MGTGQKKRMLRTTSCSWWKCTLKTLFTVPPNAGYFLGRKAHFSGARGLSALHTGEALRGDTGFASVFGPQNEGHKFTRKYNLTLDTSMAKPTPKPLLRMVEREEYSECLGASVERPV